MGVVYNFLPLEDLKVKVGQGFLVEVINVIFDGLVLDVVDQQLIQTFVALDNWLCLCVVLFKDA